MTAIRFGHIRTRLTLWFVSALAVVLLLYSSAASVLLLRDLRRQLVRHAIQDLETVEGLLQFTPEGRLTLKDDYHNNPESKRVLERLLEVRSTDGRVLFRNDLLVERSLGDTMLPGEGEGGYSPREYTLADGTKVQLVSRRHSIEGKPTIIRVAFSEDPLWQQFQVEPCWFAAPDSGHPSDRCHRRIPPRFEVSEADPGDSAKSGSYHQ